MRPPPLPRAVPTALLSVLVVVAVATGGCAPASLVPAPYALRGDAGRASMDAVPEWLKTPGIPVMYVTDRAPLEADGHGLRYGFGRNVALCWGTALVEPGPALTWEEMVEASTGGPRKGPLLLSVKNVEQAGSFVPISERLEPRDGVLHARSGSREALMAEHRAIAATMDRWLDASPTKDAYIFVHGFNNTFDDALLRFAQVWHFAGRPGVPIVYTWPAGSPGLLNYAYDRESGEFTVVHLKLLILAVAANPKVERINIIAHSRGTDVAVTALRELNAEARGLTGQTLLSLVAPPSTATAAPAAPAMPDPELGDLPVAQSRRTPDAKDILKIRNVVLAAPDIDVDVFQQRYFAENLPRASERIIIYFSNKDAAIAAADWLFGSRVRLGALAAEDIKPELRSRLSKLDCIEAVNCKVISTSSHAYLFEHPAALSDLVLLLRDNARPGEGRPLARPTEGIWEIDDSYMKPATP